MSLITCTEAGLYCAAGDFYIDPWRPVQKAVITHAHSDHARWGSAAYLCHTQTRPLLQLRLGAVNCQTLEWGEPLQLNGVEISLHPAGHIIGSSQIRVAHKGEIWVASGDYKTYSDDISGDFEPVRCQHFITESTFGLPIYQWKNQEESYAEILAWVARNQSEGYNSVFLAYSLGKAQRIISCLAAAHPVLWAHGAIYNTQEALRQSGWALPKVEWINADTPKSALNRAVIIAPPSAEDSTWMKKLNPYRLAICSGWMQVRGNARRRNADAGFVISDHADWPGLLSAVAATGAERVYVTHGFTSSFARYLNEQGQSAEELKTAFGTEEETETIPIPA